MLRAKTLKTDVSQYDERDEQVDMLKITYETSGYRLGRAVLRLEEIGAAIAHQARGGKVF
jgi:hypothetical protein